MQMWTPLKSLACQALCQFDRWFVWSGIDLFISLYPTFLSNSQGTELDKNAKVGYTIKLSQYNISYKQREMGRAANFFIDFKTILFRFKICPLNNSVVLSLYSFYTNSLLNTCALPILQNTECVCVGRLPEHAVPPGGSHHREISGLFIHGSNHKAAVNSCRIHMWEVVKS